jgi:hypothetical protein
MYDDRACENNLLIMTLGLGRGGGGVAGEHGALFTRC